MLAQGLVTLLSQAPHLRSWPCPIAFFLCDCSLISNTAFSPGPALRLLLELAVSGGVASELSPAQGVGWSVPALPVRLNGFFAVFQVLI